jgi:hypothetical protein
MGIECVRIVASRLKAGTPRGPESRRSIARFPARTVIITGAFGGKSEQARCA